MKTAIISIVLSFPLILFSQISGNNLIACYEFNGNTADAISGFNGTLVGNATVTNAFNAGLNNQDALSVPGNMINQVSEFTVSMKIKFNDFNTSSSSSANCIFSGASMSNDNLMNFVYVKNQQSGGSATLSNMFYYLHNNQRYEFPNISLVENNWYHVSLVRGANSIKLYLDGVLQSPVNGHSVPPLNLTLHPDGFIFGQDQDVLAGGYDVNQSMNGSIDNMTVYDRELTSQEVNFLFTTDEGCRTLSLLKEELSAADNILIYPNPTSDNIYIGSNAELNEKIDYQLISSLGKIVSKGSVFVNEKIELSNLKPGLYFLKVNTTFGSKSFRIIKR